MSYNSTLCLNGENSKSTYEREDDIFLSLIADMLREKRWLPARSAAVPMVRVVSQICWHHLRKGYFISDLGVKVTSAPKIMLKTKEC